MREAKAKGDEYYDQGCEQQIVSRDAVRQELESKFAEPNAGCG